MQILDELRDDHRRLRSTMTELEGGAPGVDALAAFAHDLAAHARAEDRLLFGALEPFLPGDHGPLAAMRAEHDEIERALAGLAALDLAVDADRRSLAKLIAAARSHFLKEEKVLFAFAERLLDGARLSALGEELAAARAAAHPSALSPGARVADLARDQPATIRVFQRRGLDFCCGGKRGLAESCVALGLPYPEVAAEVAASIASGAASPERDWRRAPVVELVGHLLTRFHAGLREELARLDAMARRTNERHAFGHPELAEVAATVAALRTAMVAHLDLEEREIFPALLAGRGADAGSELAVAEGEHEEVGGLLLRLRQLTGGFEPPAEACNTWRGLYFGLAELELDTHLHVHLENHVLFPRAGAALPVE